MPEPSPTSEAFERNAFYFESEGASLFAWLHAPRAARATHGVVICPPVGHEYVHAHRTLRHLANRLAAQGFAVLRFDYHGAGDSDGSDLDPKRLATWQANVRDATNWLRKNAGCNRISFAGLRLGATIAALCAEQEAVEHLILWEPVLKGRRYVRELTALSQTAKFPSKSDATWIEAVGFVYTEETADEIMELDLKKHSPRFERCLIVRNDKGSRDAVLYDHLKQLAPAEQIAVCGYDDMMAEPQFNAVPWAALDSIAAWAGEGVIEHTRPVVCTATAKQLPAHRESIHHISESPDVFGIVTEPAHDTSLPWIVVLNGGAAHRVGPGRFHVTLARHLAGLGYPCLRIDLSGLGDSEVDVGCEENDTYPFTAFRDVALTCDYLLKLQPQRRIVLMGLCSGAYAAFQSAAMLPHPAIIESILLNPLTFFWREGMSLTASPTQQLQTWHYYKSIICDWENWRQLLSGNVFSSLAGAVRRFIERMRPHPQEAAMTSIATAGSGPWAELGHPPVEDLSADLKRIVAANRRVTMFVSEGDPGHFLLMYKARRKATKLMRSGQLQCFFIPEADHTFSNEASRERLFTSLTDHLHGRFDSKAVAVVTGACSESNEAVLQPSMGGVCT